MHNIEHLLMNFKVYCKVMTLWQSTLNIGIIKVPFIQLVGLIWTINYTACLLCSTLGCEAWMRLSEESIAAVPLPVKTWPAYTWRCPLPIRWLFSTTGLQWHISVPPTDLKGKVNFLIINVDAIMVSVIVVVIIISINVIIVEVIPCILGHCWVSNYDILECSRYLLCKYCNHLIICQRLLFVNTP